MSTRLKRQSDDHDRCNEYKQDDLLHERDTLVGDEGREIKWERHKKVAHRVGEGDIGEKHHHDQRKKKEIEGDIALTDDDQLVVEQHFEADKHKRDKQDEYGQRSDFPQRERQNLQQWEIQVELLERGGISGHIAHKEVIGEHIDVRDQEAEKGDDHIFQFAETVDCQRDDDVKQEKDSREIKERGHTDESAGEENLRFNPLILVVFVQIHKAQYDEIGDENGGQWQGIAAHNHKTDEPDDREKAFLLQHIAFIKEINEQKSLRNHGEQDEGTIERLPLHDGAGDPLSTRQKSIVMRENQWGRKQTHTEICHRRGNDNNLKPSMFLQKIEHRSKSAANIH